MKNRSGKFATPGLKGILAAATSDQKPTPTTNELSIVNPPKKFPLAYPISTYTYVIVPTSVAEGAGAAEVPVLGRDEGPDVRAEAALPADPEAGARRRGEGDREDPQLGERMSSAELTTDAARRPFTGRRVRFGDLVAPGRRRGGGRSRRPSSSA